MHTCSTDCTTAILQESVRGLNMVRNEADCPELNRVFLPCFSLLILLALGCTVIHSTDINTTDQSRTLCKQNVRLTQQCSGFICAGVISLAWTAKTPTVLTGGSSAFWHRWSVIIPGSTISGDAKQRFSDAVIHAQGTPLCFKYDVYTILF